MIYSKYDIFPTPIMRFKFPREFSYKEKDFFKKIESNVRENYGNHTSIDHCILENEEMKDVKKYCDEAINTYLKKIYNPDNTNTKLYITQSWLNYTKINEFHHTHAHPNSILSGVLYVSANKKYDMITFNKGGYTQLEFFPMDGKANAYTSDEMNVEVDKYDIIVFPSKMFHRVPTTKNPETRISLAFNSFVSGTLGHEMNLNHLELK